MACTRRIFYKILTVVLFFSSLCRPISNRMKGLPFRPVKAVPVDLFPHSPHCELVLEFRRISSVQDQPAFITPSLPASAGSPTLCLPLGDKDVVADT